MAASKIELMPEIAILASQAFMHFTRFAQPRSSLESIHFTRKEFPPRSRPRLMTEMRAAASENLEQTVASCRARCLAQIPGYYCSTAKSGAYRDIYNRTAPGSGDQAHLLQGDGHGGWVLKGQLTAGFGSRARPADYLQAASSISVKGQPSSALDSNKTRAFCASTGSARPQTWLSSVQL